MNADERLERAGLPDYLRPNLEAVLIGINPGIRSSELGRHYGGRNNRFWSLLYDSGLVAPRLSAEDDFRLLDFGFGLTNIVERVTRSSSELTRADYESGGRRLASKLENYRPRLTVFVGISAYREMAPILGRRKSEPIVCGLQETTISNVPVFVLPNPSGRNAHYSYAQMLEYWKGVKEWLAE